MDTAQLTVTEAAKALGVNPRTVRRRIKRGEITCEKRECPGGFQYAIPASELEKLQSQALTMPPFPAFPLDKAIDTLERVAIRLDTVQDNVQGIVQGIVEPIVQAQERQTEEIKALREFLEKQDGSRPWWKWWGRGGE